MVDEWVNECQFICGIAAMNDGAVSLEIIVDKSVCPHSANKMKLLILCSVLCARHADDDEMLQNNSNWKLWKKKITKTTTTKMIQTNECGYWISWKYVFYYTFELIMLIACENKQN